MRDDNIDDKIDENVFRMHIRENSATLHNTNVCYCSRIFVLRFIWKISILLRKVRTPVKQEYCIELLKYTALLFLKINHRNFSFLKSF